jgi:hypothetical protein
MPTYGLDEYAIVSRKNRRRKAKMLEAMSTRPAREIQLRNREGG